MNILIVEDEKLMLMALQYSVEALGHNSFHALDSTEAIRHIRNQKIDFIFSDILMPGISGLSLVSILRHTYHLKIPIVLMSTLKTKDVRNKSEYRDVNDFIEKPFTIADIAYKISKHTSSELDN